MQTITWDGAQLSHFTTDSHPQRVAIDTRGVCFTGMHHDFINVDYVEGEPLLALAALGNNEQVIDGLQRLLRNRQGHVRDFYETAYECSLLGRKFHLQALFITSKQIYRWDLTKFGFRQNTASHAERLAIGDHSVIAELMMQSGIDGVTAAAGGYLEMLEKRTLPRAMINAEAVAVDTYSFDLDNPQNSQFNRRKVSTYTLDEFLTKAR